MNANGQPPGSIEALTAALRAISPRSTQVIIRALLERNTIGDCAAFYGISERSFLALLGRSLAELADHQGRLEARAQASGSDAPERLQQLLGDVRTSSASNRTAGELEVLVRALWETGPRGIPPSADEDTANRWWDTALRILVIAGVIAAVLYFSKAF